MDDALAMELAATQHSLITRNQALDVGLGRSWVKDRCDDGILARAHLGVYRFTSAADSRDQRLLAACLAVGSPSAASHRAAANTHGIWSTGEELVEITVGRDRSPELAGVTMHRLADLDERWITVIDGVPVTTPARTLVDLGAVLPLGSVSRALDRAIGRQLVSLSDVRVAMNAVAKKGRVGVGVIRRLLDERSSEAHIDRSASVLEARMSTLLRRYGVPTPVSEYKVHDPRGQFVGRVDFAYPGVRYAIEVDGYEAHVGLHEFRPDRVRQNDLVDLGWSLHRFTWTEVDQLSIRVAQRIRSHHAHLLGTLRGPTAA
jgi:very-short-patch-repair endonuclease